MLSFENYDQLEKADECQIGWYAVKCGEGGFSENNSRPRMQVLSHENGMPSGRSEKRTVFIFKHPNAVYNPSRKYLGPEQILPNAYPILRS